MNKTDNGSSIEISRDVFWNPSIDNQYNQSPEYLEWLQTNIYPRMAMNSDDNGENLVQPEYDKFKRPFKWTIKYNDINVIITRNYLNKNSGSWALDNDDIKFEKQ